MAPAWDYCAEAAYTGAYMFYQKQLQFESWSNYMLSFLQNFLGKVVTINRYYERFLQAMVINDVNVMSYYIGKIADLMLNFNQIDFNEDPETSLDWRDSYTPYVPPNERDYVTPDPPTLENR